MKNFHLYSLFTCCFIMCIATSTVAQNSSPKPIDSKKMLAKFIEQEMVYPESDLKQKNPGKVRFIVFVDEKGKYTDFEISQGATPAIEKEAERLMKKICWEPALNNGAPVKGKQVFEIEFHPRKYKKFVKRRGYDRIPGFNTESDTNFQVLSFRKAQTPPKALFENGGNLGAFLAEQLRYPDAAARLGIRGEVKLSFIVEPSGNSSNVIVEKDLGGGCTEEALRLLKLIRWQPASLDGSPVRVRWTLNVAFQVNRSGVGDENIPSSPNL